MTGGGEGDPDRWIVDGGGVVRVGTQQRGSRIQGKMLDRASTAMKRAVGEKSRKSSQSRPGGTACESKEDLKKKWTGTRLQSAGAAACVGQCQERTLGRRRPHQAARQPPCPARNRRGSVRWCSWKADLKKSGSTTAKRRCARTEVSPKKRRTLVSAQAICRPAVLVRRLSDTSSRALDRDRLGNDYRGDPKGDGAHPRPPGRA